MTTLRRTIQVAEDGYTGPRFVEVVLNPYPDAAGDHACVVTTCVVPPPPVTLSPEGAASDTALDLFCKVQSVTPILSSLLISLPLVMLRCHQLQ